MGSVAEHHELAARALAAKSTWREEAEAWIFSHPDGWIFSADDIVDAIGTPVPSEGQNVNNAIGGLFSSLSKQKRISKTGRAVMSRHGRTVCEWFVGYRSNERQIVDVLEMALKVAASDVRSVCAREILCEHFVETGSCDECSTASTDKMIDRWMTKAEVLTRAKQGDTLTQ